MVSFTLRPYARSMAMKMTEPDRPRDEGQGEDRERVQRTRQRIDIREDELRKHEDRGDRVDEEVEELRRAPDDHPNGDVARR